MSEQYELLGGERTIADAFDEFHANNPQVFEELRRLALRAVRSGHHQAGIGQLFEVLRWRHGLRTKGGGEFKLNNNFRAHYARALMQRERELAGFFELRRLRSE